MDRKNNASEIEIVELQNECEKVKETLTDIKLQIVATNVELVAIKKEVEGLKQETGAIRVTMQLSEKDLKYAIEKVTNDISPIKKIGALVGTLALTAIVGAILASIIVKQ